MSCGKQDIGVRRTHLHWIVIQYGEMQSSHWLLVIFVGLEFLQILSRTEITVGIFCEHNYKMLSANRYPFGAIRKSLEL